LLRHWLKNRRPFGEGRVFFRLQTTTQSLHTARFETTARVWTRGGAMQQVRYPAETVQPDVVDISAAPAGLAREVSGMSDSVTHKRRQSITSSSFTDSKHGGIWDRYLLRGPNSQDDFSDGTLSSPAAAIKDTCSTFLRELRRKVHTLHYTPGTVTRTRWSQGWAYHGNQRRSCYGYRNGAGSLLPFPGGPIICVPGQR